MNVQVKQATPWDHQIIDAVSAALGARVESEDSKTILRAEIESGNSGDKMSTAVEIAVAFARYAQDLKAENKLLATEVEELRKKPKSIGFGSY